MQDILLYAAAGVSMLTFFVHTFVGGARVARPLLANTSLPPASKWLNYYCWHIVTVTIFVICVLFVVSARSPAPFAIAASTSTFSGGLALLSAGVAVKGGINPLRFPSTSLFAIISGLGVAALMVSP